MHEVICHDGYRAAARLVTSRRLWKHRRISWHRLKQGAVDVVGEVLREAWSTSPPRGPALLARAAAHPRRRALPAAWHKRLPAVAVLIRRSAYVLPRTARSLHLCLNRYNHCGCFYTEAQHPELIRQPHTPAELAPCLIPLNCFIQLALSFLRFCEYFEVLRHIDLGWHSPCT